MARAGQIKTGFPAFNYENDMPFKDVVDQLEGIFGQLGQLNNGSEETKYGVDEDTHKWGGKRKRDIKPVRRCPEVDVDNPMGATTRRSHKRGLSDPEFYRRSTNHETFNPRLSSIISADTAEGESDYLMPDSISPPKDRPHLAQGQIAGNPRLRDSHLQNHHLHSSASMPSLAMPFGGDGDFPLAPPDLPQLPIPDLFPDIERLGNDTGGYIDDFEDLRLDSSMSRFDPSASLQNQFQESPFPNLSEENSHPLASNEMESNSSSCMGNHQTRQTSTVTLDGYDSNRYTDVDRKLKQFQPLPLPVPTSTDLPAGNRHGVVKPDSALTVGVEMKKKKHQYPLEQNSRRRRKNRKATSAIETSSDHSGVGSSTRQRGPHPPLPPSDFPLSKSAGERKTYISEASYAQQHRQHFRSVSDITDLTHAYVKEGALPYGEETSMPWHHSNQMQDLSAYPQKPMGPGQRFVNMRAGVIPSSSHARSQSHPIKRNAQNDSSPRNGKRILSKMSRPPSGPENGRFYRHAPSLSCPVPRTSNGYCLNGTKSPSPSVSTSLSSASISSNQPHEEGIYSLPDDIGGSKTRQGQGSSSSSNRNSYSVSGQSAKDGMVPSMSQGHHASSSSQTGRSRQYILNYSSSPSVSTRKSRGNYKCGRCGLPKTGHVCLVQPPVMKSNSAQCEIDVTTGKSLPDSNFTFITVSGQWEGVPDSDSDQEGEEGSDSLVTNLDGRKEFAERGSAAGGSKRVASKPSSDKKNNKTDSTIYDMPPAHERTEPGPSPHEQPEHFVGKPVPHEIFLDHEDKSVLPSPSKDREMGRKNFLSPSVEALDEQFSVQNINDRPDSLHGLYNDFDDSPRSGSTSRSLTEIGPTQQPETDDILMGYEMPDQAYVN